MCRGKGRVRTQDLGDTKRGALPTVPLALYFSLVQPIVVGLESTPPVRPILYVTDYVCDDHCDWPGASQTSDR